jgi:hypothetical protein
MTETVRRFAARVRPRQGILMLDIPVSLMITALLERGVSPARAVALRALMTRPEGMQVSHPPPHYPFPAEALARQVTRTVTRYFATGAVPRLRVTVPVEAMPAA